ncbi:cAMP-specific 3',5'-cyclic phosphodiesterase 4D [Phlyctochytrium planicorne]|nr:cAMP-specific 3',5'-cyclic phosphodiesterase 4D [Phlyctochytrium planicorne]
MHHEVTSRLEEGNNHVVSNPFDENDNGDGYLDYGDTCSTSSLTEVQELSLDRSVRSQRNSHQLPYPATTSTPPTTASDYLMRPVSAIQSVWSNIMLSASNDSESHEMKATTGQQSKEFYDDESQRKRTLSLAYLQDPSPIFTLDISSQQPPASADSNVTNYHPNLDDYQPPSSKSATLAHKTPTSPGLLVPTLDSHRNAAQSLKHARFSSLTLAFADPLVERDYALYFWGRAVRRWRMFVVVAGGLAVSYQVAVLLGKGGGNGKVEVGIWDWIVLFLGVVIPLIGISCAGWWMRGDRMARFVQGLGVSVAVLIGPGMVCLRYVHGGKGGDLGVVAPLYIVGLVASVFFLRLRFVFTVFATVVAGVTWAVVFGADAGKEGESMGEYVVSNIALGLACVVTCCIAYDLERTLRHQYLSDSRFLAITRNLQSQLEGLERSMLAVSGRNAEVSIADLDSPLEKAMVNVRSLMMDPTVRSKHKKVLDVVMACLSSPNLLTPDLDVQVKRGEVEMSSEVEKWLFSEVARRKGLESDLEGVGRGQVQGMDSGVDEEEEEEVEDVFGDQNAVELTSSSGGLKSVEEEREDEGSLPTIAVAAEFSSTELVRHQVPLSADSNTPPATPLFRHRRRSSSAIPLIPTLMMDPVSLSTLRTPKVITLLGRMHEYNFPIFEFGDATGGHPLLVMAHHLMVVGDGRRGLGGVVGRLGLSPEKFLNAMATIEEGYHADLAFHNSLHAADVLHCINYLISLPTLRDLFTDLEILSILLAAIIHDFDHPGVNNAFLIASADRRALLYNDRSVLENHHCAAAFEVLGRKECAFLGGLDRSEYKGVREGVVEMVLATDLAKHFGILTLFKKKVCVGGVVGGNACAFDPVGVREDRTLVMQMLMKCADVSNPTKSWPEYGEWINRIMEEWFMQGDKEKSLGLSISPFCNRDANMTSPAESQSSFIDFIVGPLFDAFGNWVEMGEVLGGLEANRVKWGVLLSLEKGEKMGVVKGEKKGDGKDARKGSSGMVRTKRNKSVPSLPGLVIGANGSVAAAPGTAVAPGTPRTPLTRSFSSNQGNSFVPSTPVGRTMPGSVTASSMSAADRHKRRSSSPMDLTSLTFGKE